VKLVGVICSKLTEDGGLFLTTSCVSGGRLVVFRVVEGTNPIGKIDIHVVIVT
jgi:hypothetical protein